MATLINYLNSITSEHRTKPKYIEMISKTLQPYIDIEEVANSFSYYLNLDRAFGNELDIIGEYVGASRELNFQPESSSAKLSDDDYRFLIKSKIAQNNWNGTIEGLNEIWNMMFPDSKLMIYDNQDMTTTLLLIANLSSIQIEMLLNGLLLPRPAGVQYNFTFVTKILFSYNLDNTQYSGYNKGYWEGDFKLFSLDMSNDIFDGFDEADWM